MSLCVRAVGPWVLDVLEPRWEAQTFTEKRKGEEDAQGGWSMPRLGQVSWWIPGATAHLPQDTVGAGDLADVPRGK